MKLRTYNVPLDGNTRCDVVGTPLGDHFAFCEAPHDAGSGKRSQLVHVPTGWSVWRNTNIRAARRIVAALEDLPVDWSSDDAKAIAKQARDAFAKVGHGDSASFLTAHANGSAEPRPTKTPAKRLLASAAWRGARVVDSEIVKLLDSTRGYRYRPTRCLRIEHPSGAWAVVRDE